MEKKFQEKIIGKKEIGLWFERGKDMKVVRNSMKLIPGWRDKNLKCYFCGETRSVKYSIKIIHDDCIMHRKVYACNRCALICDFDYTFD